MEPAYEDLTFEEDADNDPHTRKLLRAELTEYACALGHPGCVGEATTLFAAWLQDGGQSWVSLLACCLSRLVKYVRLFNVRLFNGKSLPV